MGPRIVRGLVRPGVAFLIGIEKNKTVENRCHLANQTDGYLPSAKCVTVGSPGTDIPEVCGKTNYSRIDSRDYSLPPSSTA